MSIHRPVSIPPVLRVGLFMGLAGGFAEIVVVWLYATVSGSDATAVARGVAFAVGLDGASATAGLIVHMGLAVTLGSLLNAVITASATLMTTGAKIGLTVGSLVFV